MHIYAHYKISCLWYLLNLFQMRMFNFELLNSIYIFLISQNCHKQLHADLKQKKTNQISLTNSTHRSIPC